MNKKIAIIISTYNCPEFIMDCIKSIKCQEPAYGWDYDIRIGVDGCKVTKAALKLKKIPFYYSEQNVGAYIIRNSLIYIEHADIYSYFDSDDIMTKNYIRTQINALSQKNINACILGKFQCDEKMHKIKNDPVIESGGAMAFTHDVLQKVGGYYRHRCAGDTDMMERIKMSGENILKINGGYYYRRRHKKSLTKSGATAYGGQYRKKVWGEMCKNRENGIIKINPTIIRLEKH